MASTVTIGWRRAFFVSFAVASSLAVCSPAIGQATFEGCVDFRGISVASGLYYQINDAATAMYAPNGAPIILYNPRVLAWMNPQTRLWMYAHECGHHALGHLGSPGTVEKEQEADCFGIKTLVDRGLVNRTGLAVIQNDILRLGRADQTHLPGGARAVNLAECLSSSRQESQGRGSGEVDLEDVTLKVLPCAARGWSCSSTFELWIDGEMKEAVDNDETGTEVSISGLSPGRHSFAVKDGSATMTSLVDGREMEFSSMSCRGYFSVLPGVSDYALLFGLKIVSPTRASYSDCKISPAR